MWFFDGREEEGVWSPRRVAERLAHRGCLPEPALLVHLGHKVCRHGASEQWRGNLGDGVSASLNLSPVSHGAGCVGLLTLDGLAAEHLFASPFQALVELACDLTARPEALSSFYHHFTLWLQASLGVVCCSVWMGEEQDHSLGCHYDSRGLLAGQRLSSHTLEALFSVTRLTGPLVLEQANRHPLAQPLAPLLTGESLLVIPIWLDGEPQGMVLCQWSSPDSPLVLEQLALLRGAMLLMSRAVEQMRISRQAEEWRRRSDLLERFSLALSAKTGMAFIDTLVERLFEVKGVEGAWLAERHGHEQLRILSAVGEHPGPEYPLMGSLCEGVYGGLSLHQRMPGDAERYYYGMPLQDGHGVVVGHLALTCLHVELVADLDSLLKILSSRIGAEMERLQVEAQLRLSAVAFETHEGIVITDPDFTILRVNKAFSQLTGYESDEVLGLTLGEGIWCGGLGYELDHLDRWQGEIQRQRRDGSVTHHWEIVTPVKDERDHLTHFVICFEDISDRKAAQRQIQDLAYYDELTGLPNRRQLQETLTSAFAEAQRSDIIGALLFIDLDHFKTINDSLGHATGDWLLREVAERLKRLTRQGDFLARLGGDEFVLLLPRLSASPPQAEMQADLVGERLIAELSAPYPFAGQSLHIGASVGVTLFPGRDQGVEDLLKQADTAMYQAKSAGRRTLRFFDASMQWQADRRLLINNELRSALENNELLLHYQPQHMVQGGEIIGVEALLRWHPPGRNMISPAEFVPIAEETDLIVDIGNWVLLEACHQFVAWEEAGIHLPQVSVNVSAKQFHAPDFVDRVHEVLAMTGMDPARLNLEITESVVLGHAEDTINKMGELKGLGISFAIDDFGAGYSSLSYLKRLPADELKIDRSFIQDIPRDADNMAIVEAVLAMAKHMGFNVTAEGVESRQQLEFLQAQGCCFYQGYLASKPLPAENLARYVQRQRRNPAMEYQVSG
ncbi:putative bifunctional diguanylate cyclase/phosphodiesterase [Aeromonas schubertii]